MKPDELSSLLLKLLEAHKLNVTPYKGWLFPEGGLPALRGSWYAPNQESRVGHLEIEIVLEDKRVIYETFAGTGDSSDGLDHALDAFSKGSFHVLLAALWGHVFEDHVSIEEWSASGEMWSAYIGDLLFRDSPAQQIDPPNMFAIIESQVAQLKLSREVHWLRTFYGNIGNGATQAEALLDNEVWESAEAAIQAANWPASPAYYSARNFLILKPRET